MAAEIKLEVANMRRAVLAIFSLFVSSAAIAQTRVGDAQLGLQPGECSVKVNNVDIGCEKGVVDTKLANGRRLINFPSNDLASVGFAGNKIEARDGHSILWLDAAYLNQKRINADGQCSAEQVSDGGFRIDCKALLEDGRKLAASLTSKSQTVSILNLGVRPMAVPCETTVKMHGMLSRAQFQCGFSKYNNDLIEQARACKNSMGEQKLSNMIALGMKLFDDNERERGRKKLCADILKDFPMYVAK